MKRLIALVLSLVMALSLCAPAWGADTVEVSTQEALVAAVAGSHQQCGNEPARAGFQTGGFIGLAG